MNNSLKSIRKKFPWGFYKLRSVYRFSKLPYRFFEQKNFQDALLLNSMKKSGSHYMMLILSNYLYLCILNDNRRLGIEEMKTKFWNIKVREALLDKIRESTGFKNFIWEHENSYIKYNNSKKIIFLYRNPLDLLISRYFYFYKNRDEKNNQVNHPRDVIEDELYSFTNHYNSVKIIKDKPNVIMISYENLIRDPFETMKNLIEFIGVEFNEEKLNDAIIKSSKKNVKKDEISNSSIEKNAVDKAVTTSFIRKGKIGEWKEYFTKEDELLVERILSENEININEFILE